MMEKEKLELEKLRHKNRMLEIRTETEGKVKVEKLHHELDLERTRIKSAEIRRPQLRKGEGYKY